MSPFPSRATWLSTAGVAFLAVGAALATGGRAERSAHQHAVVSGGATVVRRIRPETPTQSLGTMVREFSNVVYGRVLSSRQVTPEGSWPLVEYELGVDSGMQRESAETIQVCVVGGPGVELIGAPELALEEEAILSTHDAQGGAVGLMGIRQGYCPVTRSGGEARVHGTHAGEGTRLEGFVQRIEQHLYSADAQEVRS